MTTRAKHDSCIHATLDCATARKLSALTDLAMKRGTAIEELAGLVCSDGELMMAVVLPVTELVELVTRMRLGHAAIFLAHRIVGQHAPCALRVLVVGEHDVERIRLYPAGISVPGGEA